MTTYTEVFGSATVPASDAKFAAFSLTTDTTFYWRYNSSNTSYQVADIMEVTTTAGLSLTFPAANQVSVGESSIVRNTGSNTFTVKDAVGGTIGTVASGVAKLFYLNTNSTVAGTWSVLTFGTGTSSADATTLQGLGLLAIGATLNENSPVIFTATAYTVTTANRGNTLVFSSGSVACTLPALATAGDGFTLRIKNNGSGTVTLTPNGVETIDQAALAPGESVMLVAGTTGWVTVGYGRSVAFAFSRINVDVTSGSNVTLTSEQAASKIINIVGTPGSGLSVYVPAIASVYYFSNASNAQVHIRVTALGASVDIGSGQAAVIVSDGVNATSAVSSTWITSVQLPDGTNALPSLGFANSTGTGLYQSGNSTNVAVLGNTMAHFGATTTVVSSVSMEIGHNYDTGVWSGSGVDIAREVRLITPTGAVGATFFADAAGAAISSTSTTSMEVAGGALGEYITVGIGGTGGIMSGVNGNVCMYTDNLGRTQFQRGLADSSYQYVAPATGATLTIAERQTCLICAPAGTIATLTVAFPVDAMDGTEMVLATTQTITALTISLTTPQTMTPALTTLAANGYARYKYLRPYTKWVRVG